MADKNILKTPDQLQNENEELKARLNEAEEALNAIRNGEVDAIVVSGKEGDRVFSLSSADTPYRVLLEEMEEGALILNADGIILYCNSRFSTLISEPLDKIVGSKIQNFVVREERVKLGKLIRTAPKANKSGIVPFYNASLKSTVYLKLSLHNLPSGSTGEVSIVASDVSMLMQHQAKLEILVDEKNAELRKANEKLKNDLVEITRSKVISQEIESRLSALHNSMSEGMAVHEIVYDKARKASDYIIIDINPAFEKITGLKREAIIGKKATIAYSVSEAPYLTTYAKVASNGKPISFETYFPPMKKHFNISVFSPAKGKFATLFQDITERKVLENELLHQADILQSVTDAVIVTDLAYKITSWNKPSEKMYGWPAAEVTGRVIRDVVQTQTQSEKLNQIYQTIREGQTLISEHVQKTKDGGLISVECNSMPLIDSEGNTIGYVTINRDITERKLAEKALLESEERLKIALDSVQLGTWDLDLVTGVSNHSLRHDQIFGYKDLQPEWTFEIACKHMLPEYEPLFREAFAKAKETGELKFEGKVVWPDGSIHWIAPHGVVHYNKEGQPVRAIGVVEDITKEREAVEALKRNEILVRSVLDNVNSGVALIDETGRFSVFNPLFLKLFGLAEDTSIKNVNDQDWAQWKVFNIDGTLLDVNDHPVRKAAMTGKRVNQQLVGMKLPTGGELTWMLISAEPIVKDNGNIDKIICTYHDITEHKQIEEGLVFHSQLLSEINDAVFSSDGNYTITSWNKAAENIFGWTKEEALGKNSGDLLKPKVDGSSRDKERSNLRDAGHWNGEVQYIRKNGTYIFTEVNSTVLRDAKGNDKGNVIVARDISERKQAQEELKKSEQLYRAIGESIDYGIWVCDANGKNIYASESYLNLVGITQEQCSEFGWGDTLHPDDAERTMAAWKECSKTGDVWDIEHRFRGVDGKWHPILARGIPIRDDKGKITMWAGINLDISKIKQTEDALRNSEEKIRSILTNSLDIIYRINLLTGEYEFISPSAEPVMGYSPAELISLTPGKSLTLVHPDDVSILQSALAQSEKTGSAVAEYRQITKNGEYRWLSNHISIVKDSEGRLLYSDGNIRDITKNKNAEIALLLSEERLRVTLTSIGDAVITFDTQSRAEFLNPVAERLTGWSLEDAKGQPVEKVFRIINERTQVSAEDIVSKVLQEGKVVGLSNHTALISKSGIQIPIEDSAAPIKDVNGTISGVVLVFHDVTEKRSAQEALEKSEERFRNLVKNAPTAIYEIDFVNERFIAVNEAMCLNSGYSEKELLSMNISELLTEKSKAVFMSRLSELLIGQTPDDNIEYEVKKKDGTIIIAVLNMTFSFDENGRPVGAMVVGHDISERKKMEEALKESEEKLWSVLNATRESIYMFNREGIIIMSNIVGLERKHSVDNNELIGHHFSEFVTPQVAKFRQAKLDEVFKTRKPIEFEDGRDERVYHHNFFPVFKDNDVSYVVNYSTDVTERKKAADKLRESEERFRTIAESMPVQISISRISDGTLRFTNESYDKIFGYNHEELIGKKVVDLYFNPEDRNRLMEKLKQDRRLDDIEIRAKRSDGSPFWILMSIRTIIFDGEPSYLNAFVDISETKRAQEELLKYNRTLNAHSKSSQAMMHAKNEIAYLNEVCKIIKDCGYSMVWIGYAENDKRKSVKPVVHCGFDKGYINQLNISWADNEHGRGPTGTAIRTGKPSLCKNMQTDPVFAPWRKAAIARGFSSSLVLPLISEGKPFGALSIYSNETNPFIESEIELLSELANDLSYGISFLRLQESERSALKVIRENESKLKELVATKDKFFNIVAHDLKNPFTSMLGSSELLYDNIDGMSVENIKKLALILNDSAKGGYSILLNLLDWSRAQTGQLNVVPQRINLKEILEENISNLELPATIKEIGIDFEQTGDIFLTADKNILNTVIRNLLSNALKYTHKKGTVTVKTKVEPNFLTIFVKDNGVGIPPEKLDKLFKLDIRNSMPGTENEQGTGLGLKLCKEFVEMHGGTIQVESIEGKGSTFSFTIPVNPA